MREGERRAEEARARACVWPRRNPFSAFGSGLGFGSVLPTFWRLAPPSPSPSPPLLAAPSAAAAGLNATYV